MNSIDELLTIPDLHPTLKAQLEKHKALISCIVECRIVSPEVAVIAHTFNDYSPGGGVGRKSNLTVFYRDQIKSLSWQYADKWSASKDRRDLMIISLGKIEITEESDCIEIKIICLPPEGYTSRTVGFSFKRKET